VIPQTKDKIRREKKRAINTRRYGYKLFSLVFGVGFQSMPRGRGREGGGNPT
jgi:hypothetical protein